MVYIHLLAPVPLDILKGLFNYGEGAEPKKVHLKHTHLLYETALVLRYPHILSRLLILCYRDGNMLHKVISSNNNGAGVHTCLPYRALQHFGILQSLPHPRHKRVLIGLLKFRHQLYAVGNINLYLLLLHPLDAILIYLLLHLWRELVRHQFGKPVALLYGHILYSRHILYSALGSHSAKSHHVRDVVLAILLLHIAQDRTPALIVKIYIYIGHRDSLRIKEPLKEQVILYRVKLRNTQAICYHRARSRTSSRAYRDAHLPCCSNKILHNKEIIGKTHIADGLKLKLYPLHNSRSKGAISALCAIITQLAEICNRVYKLIPPVRAVPIIFTCFYYLLILFPIALYI